MKYIIINLSPREKGTSKMLTNYFAERIKSDKNSVYTCDLYLNLKKMDELLDKIKASDCVVMIGPSYVNSFPADTIDLLSSMAKKEGVLHGQSLYGFIQGGMPYIHTHEHGIRLLKCFGEDNEVVFKGGFVMGGGAILDGQPLDKIVGAKKMVPAVNEFIENIKINKNSSEELYKNAATKFPVIIAKILSTFMNQSIKRNLRKKGIDYNSPSPYMQNN